MDYGTIAVQLEGIRRQFENDATWGAIIGGAVGAAIELLHNSKVNDEDRKSQIDALQLQIDALKKLLSPTGAVVSTGAVPTGPNANHTSANPVYAPVLSGINALLTAAGGTLVFQTGATKTDKAHKFLLTAGAGNLGAAVQGHVAFGTPYSEPPIVTVTPLNIPGGGAYAPRAINVTQYGYDLYTPAAIAATDAVLLGVTVQGVGPGEQ